MAAHAITNGTAMIILFDVWIPLVVLTGILLILRRSIALTIRQFFLDWREDADAGSLWTGILGVVVIFVPGLILLPLLGRVPTLATIGAVLLLIALLNLFGEKRSR
jgi:hypothetical protein